MPSWANIEDASPKASRVWFARTVATTADTAAGADNSNRSVNSNKSDGGSPNSNETAKKSVGIWKPLRKKDCQILNDLLTSIQADDDDDGGGKKKLGAYVEEGRCTATLDADRPTTGAVTYNFVRVGRDEGRRDLSSSTWFLKDHSGSGTAESGGGGGKDHALVPIYDEGNDRAIEALYQRAVVASSSLGEGISSVVNESVTLSDESKVTIVKSGGSLKLTLKKKGWFGAAYDLQRGYGEYKVEGEEEERMLGPVGHLCFVIHGIGEAFFNQMKDRQFSIVDQMNSTRLELHRKQVTEWKAACLKAQKAQDPEPHVPNRIEVIPIEWYDRLHDSSTSLMRSLRSTTLQTIPALRAIANDVIFDVLMYLTPAFCEAVLECVTEQICDHYATFCTIHPEFPKENSCSIIGHSLGSVIGWDLLSILKDRQRDDDPLSNSIRGVNVAGAEETASEVGYRAYAHPGTADDADAGTSSHWNKAQHGTWGPSLTKRMENTIPFVPYCTIFLGSPLGIFLTLRGAHAVFDAQRKAAVERIKLEVRDSMNPDVATVVKLPAASPFTLPTKYLYNIFAGSDPVAYRIEPLLLSPDLDVGDLPPPVYLTAPGKDLRLHVKARQLGEELTKALSGTGLPVYNAGNKGGGNVGSKSHWSSLVDSTLTALASGSTSSGVRAITAGGEVDVKKYEVELETEWPPTFPLGNPSNSAGGRVDYWFQPGVVENEYVSAIMAHSSYFGNPDLIDFLVSRLSMNEDSSDFPTHDPT